jgi:predicted HNH restriction endonuclease
VGTPTRRDRRAAYDGYLSSRAWRDRRKAWYAAWLARHGTPPACRVCDRKWSLRTGHLHHLSYTRLGDEDDEDLMPLCAAHHRQLHWVLDQSVGWRRLGRRQASLGLIGLLRQGQLARTVTPMEATG